jgi:hypothetical protein
MVCRYGEEDIDWGPEHQPRPRRKFHASNRRRNNDQRKLQEKGDDIHKRMAPEVFTEG